MKHITFLALIFALLTASCSNKNGVFTKRKYTKGHYIAHTGKVAKPQLHELKQTPGVAAAQVKAEHVKSTVVAENRSAVAFAANVKPNASKALQPVNIAKTKSVETTVKPKFTQKVANHRAVNKITHAKNKKASDDDLIIWVILSLFPIACLFAVYLHDGKSITLNFWVDLILHITFWGECIFALLVVLDIINLS